MPLIKNKLYGGIHDMLEQYNDILSVEELCELLHVGRNRVYQLFTVRGAERLPARKNMEDSKNCSRRVYQIQHNMT